MRERAFDKIKRGLLEAIAYVKGDPKVTPRVRMFLVDRDGRIYPPDRKVVLKARKS